jgi:phage terminase small subunit
MWESQPQKVIRQAVNEIRHKGDEVSQFIRQVDEVHFAQQQSRQRTRDLTKMAKDVYSDLPLDGLSDTEKAFILNYNGDVKEALGAIGLRATNSNKMEVLRNPQVRECKELIDSIYFAVNVPTSAEVIAQLGDIIRDPQAKHADKIAAAKLLMQKDGLLTNSDKNQPTVQVHIQQVL